MSGFLWLLGYAEILVPSEDITAFFELCRAGGITPKDMKRDEKTGELFCRMPVFLAKRIALQATEQGFFLRVVRHGGLPKIFARFLHRPALFLGTLAALFLLIMGHLVLWDIEITGNERLQTEEVEALLSEAGLSRGMLLPRLNGDEIALFVRGRDTRISYISVNLTGTVATVQIREAEQTPAPTQKAPANLVAKRDGIVTIPLVFEGECLVRAGEAVRAGQILASGVMDTDNNGIRFTRAAGQVLARTEEVFVVEIPLEYTEKSYTGRVFREFELLFFSSRGKVFKSTGNIPTSCDIIKDEKRYYAGAHTLPVGVVQTEYREYEWVSSRRSGEEALALAKDELAAVLSRESVSRTLLTRTVETVVGEDGVKLICTATFEEDIAAVSEFSVAR